MLTGRLSFQYAVCVDFRRCTTLKRGQRDKGKPHHSHYRGQATQLSG